VNIKSEKLIERALTDREGLIKSIKSVGYWRGTRNKAEMKFAAVVGNPPYQDSSVNNHNAAIYHIFIDVAYSIADIGTLITPGRFLFGVGDTPEEWNKKIIADDRIKVVRYTSKSQEIFSNVDIKGGVAITLCDAKRKVGPIGSFTSHEELKGILQKVISDNFKPLSTIVYTPATYKLSKEAFVKVDWLKKAVGKEKRFRTNIFDKATQLFEDEKLDEHYVGIWGLVGGNKRALKWIKEEFVAENINLKLFKVIVPKANGSGAIGEVLSTPIIGTPMIGHTETFISIGCFETYEEANACYKYINGKFARTMLGTLKVTQDNLSDTWANVPLQDFTSSSDIDWSKSVAEIDQQLYDKYDLSEEEREFIESMIKPME
jgi:hypothetical protein